MSHPQTILFVEDEQIARRTISLFLQKSGFAVLEAGDGTRACQVIDALRGKDLDLLITDVDLPGCDGMEVAEYARRRFSALKVIYISATPQPDLSREISLDAGKSFLEKPFRRDDLLTRISEMEAVGVQ